jgi:hypothetical protein
VTEGAEDEREGDLLGTSLDERRGTGQEQLTALGVELAGDGAGRPCWSSVQIAASTFDLPTLGPPTSAQTRPGANPAYRADRNPRIRTSRTPNPGPDIGPA